jgi:hypothetical protein
MKLGEIMKLSEDFAVSVGLIPQPIKVAGDIKNSITERLKRTGGTPEDIIEGLVVEQEELYDYLRKVAGPYVFTHDYFTDVVNELRKEDIKVLTRKQIGYSRNKVQKPSIRP